mmetsp:Transcript_52994/g.119156  ORF Transcript_52994/g.119156 Transcript_52994/m.119156 type:complete len:219 (+) Transcript_52994:82-738(+)
MAGCLLRAFARRPCGFGPSLLSPMRRSFAAPAAAAESTSTLSETASKALGTIKESMSKARTLHMTKAQKRNFQGDLKRYRLMGGRPEFHNADKNKNGRLFEPWHTFEVIITSSKNNCNIIVKNKSWSQRVMFMSYGGNVGWRKGLRKTEPATYRVALNIARKLKRLGVSSAEVTFRKILKVETCLQAFQSVGLQVTRLLHRPRLPKGPEGKPKKQRRV